MKYDGSIIRPPSEADSLLLQVTVGCSHNKCTFCAAYKVKRFRIKSFEEIEEDIIEAVRYRGRFDRVFLCDGDALIIPQKRLTEILQSIRRHLPWVVRIGTYANAKSIMKKTSEELTELKQLGLGIVYLGVESGNEEILQQVHKGADPEKMIAAGKRVKEAGIELSVTVLLGIGGREKSVEHARDTAKILTAIDPDYVGALTVMVVPGTPLYDELRAGRFVLPDTFGFIQELGMIVAQSGFTNCFFTSNHASNYLPIRARMPQDKEKTIEKIVNVIKSGDQGKLRPEYMRGL
jgi:radical SAM superfamily enzyme YgiQ (UPF0313 family)